MEALIGLMCLMIIVGLFGVGAWVAGAWIIKAFRDEPPKRQPAPPTAAPPSPTTELGDLQAMRRQVNRFAVQGVLQPDAARALLLQIDQRTETLQGRKPAADSLTPETVTPLAELEKLLARLAQLDPFQRRQALALFDKLSVTGCEKLPPSRLYDLGKLLTEAGRVPVALDVLRRLIVLHPAHPASLQTSLEAAELAARHQHRADAVYFAEQALTFNPPPLARARAEKILNDLSSVAEAPTPVTSPATVPVEKLVEAPAVETPTTATAQEPPMVAADVVDADVVEPTTPSVSESTPDVTTIPAPIVPAPSLPDFKPEPVPVMASVAQRKPLAEIFTPPPSRPATPPPPPPPPKKPFAEVLAAFMEEKNIRWGELVGGLLIVGCSIALVISLWDTVEQSPILRLSVFGGLVASLFGVGLYSEHRWKLGSTSRGLLMIATLLTPLNFLAMSSQPGQDVGFSVTLARIISLALFTWLMTLAGRIIAGRQWLLMAATVAGNCGIMLLIGRWVPLGAASLEITSWGLAAAAVFGGCIGFALWQSRTKPEWEPADAWSLFTLTGGGAFALLLAWGLLASRAEPPSLALDDLAWVFSLAAAPLAAVGFATWQRLPDNEEAASLRTAGTALSFVGMFAALASLLLAWPQPAQVLLAGTVNFTALSILAWRYRFPAAHLLAVPSALVVYSISTQWLAGHVTFLEPMTVGVWFSPEVIASCGLWLVGAVAALVVSGEWLRRGPHAAHAPYYLALAAVVAMLSVGMTTASGWRFPEQAWSAWGVYTLYGLTALAGNFYWRRPTVSYAALALLLLSGGWGLWAFQSQFTPAWGALLAVETLLLAAASRWIMYRLSAKSEDQQLPAWSAAVFGDPLCLMSSVALVVSALLGIASWLKLWNAVEPPWSLAHVLNSACLTVAALLLAQRTWTFSMARWSALMFSFVVLSATGYLGQLQHTPDSLAWSGFWLAAAGVLLAGSSLLALRPSQHMESSGKSTAVPHTSSSSAPWRWQLGGAWLEMAAVPVVFAWIMSLTAPSLGGSAWPMGTGILTASI